MAEAISGFLPQDAKDRTLADCLFARAASRPRRKSQTNHHEQDLDTSEHPLSVTNCRPAFGIRENVSLAPRRCSSRAQPARQTIPPRQLLGDAAGEAIQDLPFNAPTRHRVLGARHGDRFIATLPSSSL